MDYVDIALIKKCNTIDCPALQSTLKACEKALLRYLSYPGNNSDYCDHISSVLNRAESWSLQIVQAYTDAEIHSINTSIGDASDVGVFHDNSERTIFKFLEAVDHAYVGTGNNRQQRLYKDYVKMK